MTDMAIQLENLTCDFEAARTVDSLSLEVPAGTIFGFLGPNGAGKATTVRLLLGHQGEGEMGLVGHHERSASPVAVEESELLCIPADRSLASTNKNPGINWAVLSVQDDRPQEADAARMAIVQEALDLVRRVVDLTGETERLTELARVRQETIELVVHDLRTPVTVIEGCLEMLQTYYPEEAAERVLALAERSTERMTALLEELLGAARQEQGLVALVREPVDLSQTLQEAMESARATAAGADLELTLNLANPVRWAVLGDRAQLRRVVDNLLENAMSYAPGGGKITVALRKMEDEIEVSVTDTGPGIPAEHREMIFERFTRVPGVQGRRRGFGLGLYFCRQVIETHGGRIWVEPGPGQVGSRFVFTLPRQQ